MVKMELPSMGASSAIGSSSLFTEDEVSRFHRDGFLCVRGLASPEDVAGMRQVTEIGLRDEIGPVEFEAELHYPGAPESFDAEGGRTIRRLKQALSRDFRFTEWIIRQDVLGRLRQLLGPKVVCPMAHHNCIMTKQPQYSSETGWHQDIRYWSYTRADLINIWIALGPETPENGCLQVIPGSHRMDFDKNQYDGDVFFRTDLSENKRLIDTKKFVELSPGDVLLFHCKTLHAASRNTTNVPKFSVVFTFRGADNAPLPGTRSSSLPEILLTPGCE